MLLRRDVSPHPWLGDRMPPFTVLIAVNDVAGTKLDVLFCEE